MLEPLAIPLCLLLVLGPAAAEDEKTGEPKQAPPASPKPLTAEQVAEAVEKALQAQDAKALRSLAAVDDPDPWIVADELCFRGQHDAAVASDRVQHEAVTRPASPVDP